MPFDFAQHIYLDPADLVVVCLPVCLQLVGGANTIFKAVVLWCQQFAYKPLG